MSLVIGVLIMSNKTNRRLYPQKYLGMICISQAAYFWFFHSSAYNLCYGSSISIFRRSLFNI
jgi:hypothetical protein